MPIELKSNRSISARAEVPAEVLHQLSEAIANIRYGSVEVLIHDARVVQIEAREKIRLGNGNGNTAGAQEAHG